jgi:hypothetical protein
MGIKEEIFDTFFDKLMADDSFPEATLEELKELYEQNSLNSEDKIIIAIEKGFENGSEN